MIGIFSATTTCFAQTPTTITIGTNVQLSSVKHLGINLGGEDYWDSRQMTRNIIFRNPGFEGETWQSIIHCKTITSYTCTDDNPLAVWPTNFFQNATAEFIAGGATGVTVTVKLSYVASASKGTGVELQFLTPPAGMLAGDYLVVRMARPGNAPAGWTTSITNGASLATDFSDISPASPGVQALQINASGANQSAQIIGYADSQAGNSFLQLHGGYTLSFRAKGLGGSNQVLVNLYRSTSGASIQYFKQTVALTSSWQDYSYYFQTNDTGVQGTIVLMFQATQSSMYLDDVQVTADSAPSNPTAFRNEVVSTLQALQPGILRYMDGGTDFGSSIDNMLAPPLARVRPGYSGTNSESDDIPMGLHEFMVLCQTVGAEPWYTLPPGMSAKEMSNLMDYFGGSSTTVYGAKRAALGQTAPWTSVFPTIHLELGNEVWDTIFTGANMVVPAGYGQRATTLFGTAKASSSYSSKSFDLVLDGWAIGTTWNKGVLAASSNYDSIDLAPYLFNSFNDTSSTENIFGPMFAQPESLDSVSTGSVYAQAQIAAAANPPANVNIYETNLSTLTGSATQAYVNSTVPSLGAGLTVTEHMLLMMRDLGIRNQSMFLLGGYQAPFAGPVSNMKVPLYGSVIDMGGLTNRVRPNYIAEQLANSAILPTMLTATQSGANPTWNQSLSTNDKISLAAAHYIQSFAFTNGAQNNIILFNLHRTQALPVVFAGVNAPTGPITVTTLTSAAITNSNETAANVATTTSSQTLLAGATMTLPPFSMTVINSAAASGSSSIAGVTASCGAASLPAMASTPCAATVTGTGTFNSSVAWQATQGSISTAGVYTAPASVPTGTTATVTATSIQYATQTATATINLTAPASSITSVAVSCAAGTLTVGGTTTCTAAVQGTGSFSSAVTWSASAGTITASGNFTAPASGTSVTITATSQQDTTKSSSTTITLTPAASTITSVAATCAASSLTVGGTTTCTAAVQGTGSFSSAVTWSASAGTITASGNFTAPASGTSVTITATSQQDITKYGAFSITLTASTTLQLSTPTITPARTTATISWTTSIPTNSGVDYGTTNSYGSTTPWISGYTTSQSFTLTGLTPATQYYILLFSSTAAGQTATAPYIFTTAP